MSVERYRRHAEKCLEGAQKARAEQDKAMLLSMAEAWLELAQKHERPTVAVSLPAGDIAVDRMIGRRWTLEPR